MIAIPDIVSLETQIRLDGIIFHGIALAEKYPNGNIIFLERFYKNLSDLEIDLAINRNQERIVNIKKDWGEMFEEITTK